MVTSALSPIAVSLGPLTIRWYGILYALAVLLGYLYLKREQQRQGLHLDVDRLIVYLIVGEIIGARLFEVLFYNPAYFFSNPTKIIALWEGGLSFHGGLVGGILALVLFCKKEKHSFLQIADLLVVPLAFGLFLGRIGNFINAELYGKITTVPWCVEFPGIEGCRHPTQLYEALKSLFIAVILVKTRKNARPGQQLGLFLVLYAILRSIIEIWKVPEVAFGSLTLGQLFNIPLLIIGLVLLFRNQAKKT